MAAFKLLVCGGPKCGVTSFLLRLTDNVFHDSTSAAELNTGTGFRDTYRKVLVVDGVQVEFLMVDGGREHTFRTTTSSFYRHSAGILACFDLTSADSFAVDLRGELGDAERYAEQATCFIVGLKSDLESKRAVTKEQMMRLGLPCYECSSKTGAGIAELLPSIARVLLNKKANKDASPTGRPAAARPSPSLARERLKNVVVTSGTGRKSQSLRTKKEKKKENEKEKSRTLNLHKLFSSPSPSPSSPNVEEDRTPSPKPETYVPRQPPQVGSPTVAHQGSSGATKNSGSSLSLPTSLLSKKRLSGSTDSPRTYDINIADDERRHAILAAPLPDGSVPPYVRAPPNLGLHRQLSDPKSSLTSSVPTISISGDTKTVPLSTSVPLPLVTDTPKTGGHLEPESRSRSNSKPDDTQGPPRIGTRSIDRLKEEVSKMQQQKKGYTSSSYGNYGGAMSCGYGYSDGYSGYSGDGSANGDDETNDSDSSDKSKSERIFHTEEGHFDWNDRFQQVFSRYLAVPEVDTSLREYQTLSTELFQLAQDFLSCVKTYGRIIIEERYFKRKTIEPSKILGGQAGGDKYIIRNILFKFAIDSSGLFHGDYGAIKVAGQELKGLMSAISCGIPGLYFPFMALVDFMGWRLIAMSLLPIDKSTIVYGSDDGGETIHADDNAFSEMMEKLGKSLNIKPRAVSLGGRSGTLYTAVDVEGHRGLDGRYYLLDLSRMFPPTKPDRAITAGHLFQLFRFEFLKSYRKPLNPDSFSKFLSQDQLRSEHNAEVREATEYLLKEIIPPFAKSIKWVVLEAKMQGTLNKLNLVQELHRKGINLRMIGHILEHVEDPDSTMLLLVEALARVLKNQLYERLRLKMQEFAVPVMVPYKQLIIDFLNMVFCDQPRYQSDNYWNNTVTSELRAKFYVSERFELDLRKPTASLRAILDRRIQDTTLAGRELLFKRFCQLTNLSFRSSAFTKVLATSPHEQAFDIMDLKKIGVRLKNTPLTINAEGTFLYSKAFQERTTEDIIDLFTQAKEKFVLSLHSNPTDKTTLKLAAITSLKILEFTVSKGKNISEVKFDMKDPAVISTDLFFLRALDAEQSSHLLFLYARFLDKCGRYARADEYFLRSLTIDPNNTRCLETYALFLAEQGNLSMGDRFFARRSLLADFVFDLSSGKWQRLSSS